MKAPFPLALAACLSSPTLAGPAEDFARLRAAFPALYFGTDTGQHMKLNAGLVKWMEGRWTLVSPLMEDGVTFPEDDLIAKGCDRLTFTSAADGNLSLTLTMETKAEPYVIRFNWAGGSSYIVTMDEAGLLARLFPGKAFEDLQPQQLASALTNSAWLGYVTLTPAGEDLVLLQPQARPPILLARCS